MTTVGAITISTTRTMGSTGIKVATTYFRRSTTMATFLAILAAHEYRLESLHGNNANLATIGVHLDTTITATAVKEPLIRQFSTSSERSFAETCDHFLT